MNYLEYKELKEFTLQSGNLDAILHLMDFGEKAINSRIDSFKYRHSDLNKEQLKILLGMNDLCEDDVLMGGEVHRVVGDVKTKRVVLKKVDEIDLFKVLEQIQFIKKNY